MALAVHLESAGKRCVLAAPKMYVSSERMEIWGGPFPYDGRVPQSVQRLLWDMEARLEGEQFARHSEEAIVGR